MSLNKGVRFARNEFFEKIRLFNENIDHLRSKSQNKNFKFFENILLKDILQMPIYI